MTRVRDWLRRAHVTFPMTRGAAYSVTFLFVLCLLTSGTAYWLSAAAIHRATADAASTLQLCQLGNQARTQQVTLWTELVAISQPPPHQTPAQRQQRRTVVRTFLAYVHRLFKPRNCRALKGQP